MTSKPIDIALVLYSGAQQAAILGMTDLFKTANRMAARESTGLSLAVSQWQPYKNVQPKPVAGALANTPAAIILPPTLEDPAQVPIPAPFIDWLNDSHSQGAVICSVCGGAFLLARSGILHGRTATTHWMFTEKVEALYPQVRWATERLIVDDGDVITAGGAMSWTDLGLRLVERFLGARVMLETARTLLIDPPGREQRYYRPFAPRLKHGDKAILTVQHWLQSVDGKESSVAVLAAKAGLEKRTFLRRFQRATGLTSTDYCQHIRVSKAQDALQFSRTPIETIAWEVGYRDPASFRKIFTRIVGLGPGEYRKRFSVQAK
ncbi:GlxA family transcriptional regulator [Gilvimarinus agarilyticus]|uniref:GlxA family transcriptional regulator n=1 Tax=Gilvimarinus agarilyticus TaxID=679259 RepID=UPI0005A0E4A3|nr:helix-turn-helix domain-containing protein [Gilvimarinus agarilyticus]